MGLVLSGDGDGTGGGDDGAGNGGAGNGGTGNDGAGNAGAGGGAAGGAVPIAPPASVISTGALAPATAAGVGIGDRAGGSSGGPACAVGNAPGLGSGSNGVFNFASASRTTESGKVAGAAAGVSGASAGASTWTSGAALVRTRAGSAAGIGTTFGVASSCTATCATDGWAAFEAGAGARLGAGAGAALGFAPSFCGVDGGLGITMINGRDSGAAVGAACARPASDVRTNRQAATTQGVPIRAIMTAKRTHEKPRKPCRMSVAMRLTSISNLVTWVSLDSPDDDAFPSLQRHPGMRR
jgi:hypothetical protein